MLGFQEVAGKRNNKKNKLQYLLSAPLVTNDSLCLLPTLKQGESHRSVNTQESKKTDLKKSFANYPTDWTSIQGEEWLERSFI